MNILVDFGIKHVISCHLVQEVLGPGSSEQRHYIMIMNWFRRGTCVCHVVTGEEFN